MCWVGFMDVSQRILVSLLAVVVFLSCTPEFDGNVYSEQGDYEKAIEAYDEAIRVID